MSEAAFACTARTTTNSNTRRSTVPRGCAANSPVITAVLATVGAIFSYMGGATQANAGLYKNDAAIKKTEASNQWNYYQAKSSKQNLAELAHRARARRRASRSTPAKIERYKAEKNEIKLAAEKLEPSRTTGTAERRADAPAPPLGAGDDRAADLDRAGGDRAADEEPHGCSTASSAWRRSAWRSACSPGCTSTRRREVRRRYLSEARRQLVDLAPELGDLDLLACDRRRSPRRDRGISRKSNLVDPPLGLTVELLLERREVRLLRSSACLRGRAGCCWRGRAAPRAPPGAWKARREARAEGG